MKYRNQNRTNGASNLRRAAQRGVTVIETLITIAILATFLATAAIGYSVYHKSRGSTEGKYISYAMTCATTTNNAANFGSTTLAVMVNKDCFGAGGSNSNVTGAGTAAASATSKLSGTAYTIAAVNLSGGTNNGLQVTVGAIPKRNCIGTVEALDSTAARITVTPTGGALSTVKADNGNLNDALLGLACNSADTASIAAAAS